MPLFPNQKDTLPDSELLRPFQKRIKEAILKDDLPTAIAFINRAITLVPNCYGLYVKRAQIYQYGMDNYSDALKDYRYVLQQLESQPDPQLQAKCKQGIRDMMERSQPDEP